MSLSPAQASNESAYGIWADSVAELMSYRYLGCRSVLADGYKARGTMTLRRDMRLGDGLLAAPVAIAMLDTAGIAIDRHWLLALTHITVNLRPVSTRARTMQVDGSATRIARTQVFTEALFVDADDPGLLIGSGTADWAVIATTPTGFDYIDPGPGVDDDPDLPPLWRAYDARPHEAGGLVIPKLTAQLGGVALHHGPILVALEATALNFADAKHVDSLEVRIVKAGKVGPFVTSGRVLWADTESVVIRSELRDEGAASALVAAATLRVCPRRV